MGFTGIYQFNGIFKLIMEHSTSPVAWLTIAISYPLIDGVTYWDLPS